MLFRVVEIDLIDTQPAHDASDRAHGTRPHGTLQRQSTSSDIVQTIRFSDLGYVDENHQPYPPVVTQAFDLDRGLSLSSDALGGASTYGSLTLINDGSLDRVISQQINDHLPVRVLSGRKVYDPLRNRWSDPPRSDLTPVFAGLGTVWEPGLRDLTIPLSGALSWLDVDLVGRVYAGTGGLQGDTNVSGQSLPKLRGRVTNITPVLIDAVNSVYQVNDGPATISALYEGGYAGGIVSAGVVADLYAASPDPGTYTIQTSSTGTWIRLGTKPVYGITVDAFGSFPSGADPVNILDILRQMLLDDFVLPSAYLDPDWTEQSALAPWPGGWFWSGDTTSTTGQDVVRTLLAGTGISLIPTRSGTLRPIRLAVPTTAMAPVLELTTDTITDISPVTLNSSLNPPTWRWRVGYQHVFTVQTSGSGLHPQAPADRQALIGQSDRYGLWYRTTVRTRWRVPNDPTPIVTALASQPDAEALANGLGALWGELRTLWAVTIPTELAQKAELGDCVTLDAPIPGLAGGVTGLVVAEHVRSSEATTTLQVLVVGQPIDLSTLGDFGGDIV